MPVLRRRAASRIYRSLQFGKHGRADHHGPAPVPRQPALRRRRRRRRAPTATSRAPSSGRQQMDWVKRRAGAAPRPRGRSWPTRSRSCRPRCSATPTTPTTAGRATRSEREELLTHIRDKRIKDVVFVTGDIHTFIAGDVRTTMGDGRDRRAGVRRRLDHVAGRWARPTSTRAAATVIKGNDANPNTPPGAHRRAARHQPVGRQRRLRPPRLRLGHRDAAGLRRASSCACRRSSSGPRRRCPPPASGGRCSAGRRRWPEPGRGGRDAARTAATARAGRCGRGCDRAASKARGRGRR